MTCFRLDFCSTNGRRHARVSEADVERTVHEWTSWLRIRSDVSGFVAPLGDPDDDDFTGFVPPVFEEDGLALLVVTRPQRDLEGQAIGLFHGRLDRDELERLRAAVEGTPWSALPRPLGGERTAPNLELRHERGDLLIHRQFNAANGNFIKAIAPLLDLLEHRLTRVSKAATLELGVSAELHGLHGTLRVVFRNRGVGGIVLTDPRVGSDGRPRLIVRVAERVSAHEQFEPREWSNVTIPPLPEGAPRSLIIPGKRRFVLDLPWTAPRPGRYLVRVAWQDYGGPLEPVVGQTPWMPLPERGPSYLGSGPYPIRGANLASRRFEIDQSSA